MQNQYTKEEFFRVPRSRDDILGSGAYERKITHIGVENARPGGRFFTGRDELVDLSLRSLNTLDAIVQTVTSDDFTPDRALIVHAPIAPQELTCTYRRNQRLRKEGKESKDKPIFLYNQNTLFRHLESLHHPSFNSITEYQEAKTPMWQQRAKCIDHAKEQEVKDNIVSLFGSITWTPVESRDRRLRRVLLVDCLEAVRMISFAEQRQEASPYRFKVQSVTRDIDGRATCYVRVPSRSNRRENHYVTLSNVPTLDNPESFNIIRSLSSQSTVIKDHVLADQKDKEVMCFGPHSIAAYFSLISRGFARDRDTKTGKHRIPAEYKHNPFPMARVGTMELLHRLRGQLMVRVHKTYWDAEQKVPVTHIDGGKRKKICLTEHVRPLTLAELEILMCRYVMLTDNRSLFHKTQNHTGRTHDDVRKMKDLGVPVLSAKRALCPHLL